MLNSILKLKGPLSANSNTSPADVLAAKTFFQDQGFFEPPEWGVTDFPDRALFSAIEAFQKSKGLRVDGMMRPEGETENATQLIQAQALNLQSMGRNGDTILAHITPGEARLLKAQGGSGTINPKTGLMEFSRFGGNNYSRDRAEKAQNKADSANRAATGNQRSGDWSTEKNRTLGYNDFNPGGMFGGNNRNGTAKTGADLAAHNRAIAGQKAAKEKSERDEKAKQQQLVAQEHRKEQELQDKERRAFYDAMPDMTDPEDEENKGLLTESNKPQANQNQLSSLIGNDDTNPRRSSPAKPTAEDRLTKAVRDLQASEPNTRTLDVNKIGSHSSPQTEKAQISAEDQELNDRIAVERANAARRAPDRTFTDAQLKGAAQANLSRIKNGKALRDLMSRAQVNVDKSKVQGGTLTGAQSLAHEIDKLRTESKTKQSVSDAAIGNVITGLKDNIRQIDPNVAFSYNELADAARNILENNGKTSAVQDYLSSQNANKSKGVQVAFAPAIPAGIAMYEALAAAGLLGGAGWAGSEAGKALRDWLSEDDPFSAPHPGLGKADLPEYDQNNYPQYNNGLPNGTLVNPNPEDNGLVSPSPGYPDQSEDLNKPDIVSMDSHEKSKLNETAKIHGKTYNEVSRTLHSLKKGAGMKGKSVDIDPHTTEIKDRQNGETIGHLEDWW